MTELVPIPTPEDGSMRGTKAWDIISGDADGELTIGGPAISYRGKVYALHKPARHNDVRRYIREDHPDYMYEVDEVPGFWTSTMEFLNRRESAHVAISENLVLPGKRIGSSGGLYSEDLW